MHRTDVHDQKYSLVRLKLVRGVDCASARWIDRGYEELYSDPVADTGNERRIAGVDAKGDRGVRMRGRGAAL